MEALSPTECSLLAALLRRRSIRSAAGVVEMSPSSAMRLIQRLERKNDVQLVTSGAAGPALTAYGRLLLRASAELHECLRTRTTIDHPDHRPVRLASALESRMDVEPLALLSPPLVVDVTETDSAHAIDLFDGGAADALALWQCSGAALPARDTITTSLFEEDLWVVGRDVPARPCTTYELAETLAWTTTSSQSDLFHSLLGMPAGSERVRVVESRQAHRILILAGRASGLVPASHLAEYECRGLGRARPEGLVRRAVLYTDPMCRQQGRLDQIQAMFRDRTRRMPSTGTTGGSSVPPPTAHVTGLELDDVALLRAIGRHGSLNRAASDLCLTQPALTRRLRRLEQRVGTVFVLRTATGSSLTHEAEQIVKSVDTALCRFRAAVSRPRQDPPRPGPDTGPTTVAGAPPAAGRGLGGVVGVGPHVALGEVAPVHGPRLLPEAEVDLEQHLVTS